MAMSNNSQKVRTAYIYSRVSKTIQAIHGEGISRQIDKAHHFIEQTNKIHAQKGLPLYQVADELIIDQGLSAYIGANTTNNAMLGAFLQAARNGKIPENSLLVVEAVDRISVIVHQGNLT
ncbi:recombinase family protein [Vibrio sp.]|uniref:recombinase family protein n=1 Tax=Vibrio sp. TaxID=678 RepID=UPI0037A82427